MLLDTNEKLNDQALQFELLIQKMRPDLLAKSDRIVPKDVRFMTTPEQHARDMLQRQGIIGSQTALLDQVTGTVDTQARLTVQDPKPDAHLKDLMKMISELSAKVDSIKHLPSAAVTQ